MSFKEEKDRPVPTPRKLPKQGRSKVLVDALVEACERLLEAGETEALTTNHIADVAGVNIGSLYQYFPNKEAILATVFARKMSAECADFAQQSTQRILIQSSKSLEDALREVVLIKAELHNRFLALHGDFYREYHDFFNFEATVDEFVSEDLQQPKWSAWLEALLGHYREQLSIQDTARAAFIVGTVIDGLLKSALEQHPEWLQEELFLQQITLAAVNAVSTVVVA